MWREKKEKKRKEINISKVVKVRILNLYLDLPWKDLTIKFWKIIEDYKTLIFLKFQKKRICFGRFMSFWKLCVRSGFFGHISFIWAFWDLQLWDLKNNKGIYMWKKFHVIWYVWERFKYLKFQPQFWNQFLLKTISLCDHHQ